MTGGSVPAGGPPSVSGARDHGAAASLIVLGSGYRGTVEALGPDARARVREQCLTRLRDVTSVRVPAIYGTARKVGSERPG